MATVKPHTECGHNLPDCFALVQGHCQILFDTRFKHKRVCPFYKPREQYERERYEFWYGKGVK